MNSTLTTHPTSLPSHRPALRTLPLDVLCTITRYLSTTPHASYWSVNVPQAVIALLYTTGGIPLTLARQYFNTLTTTDAIWCPHKPPSKHGGIFTIQDDASNHTFINLLHIATPFLSELNIAHSARFTAWTQAAAHCTSLRRLRVTHADALLAPLCTLLQRRASTLIAIELQGNSALPVALADALSSHATALRELALDFGTLPPAACHTLWVTRGAQIRKLGIARSCTHALFDGMRRQCTALRDLHVTTGRLAKDAQHALTALLISIADLQRLSLHGGISAAHWRIVAKRCANVDVEIRGNDALSAAVALGPRLSALSTSNLAICEGLGACSRLRKLEASGPTPVLAALVRALRTAPLEVATLREWGGGGEGGAELLDALATGGGGLTQLMLGMEWTPVGAFDALAAANAGLKHVVIHFSGVTAVERIVLDRKGRTGRVLASVVQAFVKCVRVCTIVVKDVAYLAARRFHRVDKACGAVSGRQVNVVVCGVQYAPTH